MTVSWIQILDLEKKMSKMVIELYNKYELSDPIDEYITDEFYGVINLKKEENDLIINFKNCMLKNKFIVNKSSKNICSVCYNECIQTLNCRHYLCNDCILSWMGEHNSCPICRSTNNYEKGFNFIIPIKMIKKSLNKDWLCFNYRLKKVISIRYLHSILHKTRKLKLSNPLQQDNRIYRYG